LNAHRKHATSLRHKLAVPLLILLMAVSWSRLHAQSFTVTGQVNLRAEESKKKHKEPKADVVVWLTPLDERAALREVSQQNPVHPPRLVQKNKHFEPHLLVIPAGTAVEFPNHDPFFHNVFSLFEGKRFDLGLYEAGTTRVVHFDRAGVSYIFCNIHPEMSAVVIAVHTPYYGVSDANGRVSIPGVPEGRYTMQVWSERASVDTLKGLNREVNVSSAEHSLGTMQLAEDSPPAPHKNKYGRDYDAPGSDYPIEQK
jgi:plastocyanin